ncbi:MAG TPA: hypothetical protein VEH04_08190 [Verrucomicrobiae bacterium]|nr:hypothetical protein [Verrucomicrobiae bacterium]
MKTSSELTVVESHGQSREQLESLPHVRIESHWNDRDLIVLKVLDQEVTLVAREVIAAVENAKNTGRGY